ncbi:MAG: hypothetical protein ABSA02_26205 [Trebonia sp.]|jgi:hypothetical protein
MRGRVLALWQVAFQGTTPVGGPVIGRIIALTDPRIGLAAGGGSCFAAAIGGAGVRRYVGLWGIAAFLVTKVNPGNQARRAKVLAGQ